MNTTTNQPDTTAAVRKSNFVTKGSLTINDQGRSPYQVIASLPKTATEEQKDSAIQANFRPAAVVSQVDVDTLCAYGLTPRSLHYAGEPRLSDYSVFAGDKYYQSGMPVKATGMLGDPIPYTVSRDNTITSLLIACFILSMVVVSASRNFILRQAKNFFYMPRSVANMTETTGEVRFQMFLTLQTALLLSITYYIYARAFEGKQFIIDSQLVVIAVFFAVFAIYFLAKGIVYATVNWVFFDKKKNEQWGKTRLFLNSIEGVALFPLVLLIVYFRLAIPTAIICSLSVVVLVKLLTFYKCFAIFFKRTGIPLHFFLYLCALELIPLAVLWGALMTTSNYLEIIF